MDKVGKSIIAAEEKNIAIKDRQKTDLDSPLVSDDGDGGLESFRQGVTDRIEAETVPDRRRYTGALLIKTFFEIYLPLILALIMRVWTSVRTDESETSSSTANVAYQYWHFSYG